MTGKRWYQQSYRRNLIDMHIADWDDKFLSEFDPKTYVDMLELSDVNTAILYAGSCEGICHWPTKAGHMHRGLKGRDMIGELLELCRERNMHTVVYFNMYSRWAYDTYPDWRMHTVKGQTSVERGSRYGLLCPNSSYDEYVVAQIEDLCVNYAFDGIWIDMIGWYNSVCYCRHCRDKFAGATGKPLPETIDWGNPDWVAFQRKREEWVAEFAAKMTRAAKAIKPAVSFVHTCTTGLRGWGGGGSYAFYRESEYLAGDFLDDPVKQSFVCKFLNALSENKPIEFMTPRCLNLRYHTTTKSRETLEAQVFSAMANQASFLFIDAIDPVGTLNRDVYAMMGDIFQGTKPYETYLDPNAKLCADVGIYFNFESMIEWEDNGKNVLNATRENVPVLRLMNVAKTLMTRHIPYGVVTGKNLAELYDYQVIVLPEIVALNEAEKEALRRYVASGGSVYASRHTSWTTEKGEVSGDFGLADLFGVSYTGETVEKITYMSPTPEGAACFPDSTDRYPMLFSGPQVQLAAHEGVEVWAKLTLPFTVPTDNNRYAVGTSNPPGIRTELPALVLNRYGSGKAMYSAGDFERMAENQQRDVFAELVRSLMSGPPLFATNAPKPVEITLFHQPGRQRYIVSLINFQSDMPNIPIHDIELEIRWSGERKVDKLLLLPAETETTYSVRDGYVRFSAPRLDTFLMFALCYSE